MSQKIKSALYLLGFVVAALIYYNETNTDQALQSAEMASIDVEHVSDMKALD